MYRHFDNKFDSPFNRMPHGARAPDAAIPEGRAIDLPGRGKAVVHEMGGPAGAPAIILLHGWYITSAFNWPGAFTALSKHFRVVAFDQRGHGQGIQARGPFRLEDCADDVVAVADALSLERVIPVGYSMGGPIAMLTARRHPTRVAGMVFCATSLSFRDRDTTTAPFVEAVGMALRWTPTSIQRYFTNVMPRPSGVSAALWQETRHNDPAALAEALGALRRFDARPWVEELGVPTASVITTRDQVVSPVDQQELARLTNATVQLVDDGHEAAARRPQLFLPALLRASLSVARVTA